MNYFNYPYNNYYANQIQYRPLYQPIQSNYYHYQCVQPLHFYRNRQAQPISIPQSQLYMTTDYSLPPQQSTLFQEFLQDMTIAVMKQSNNKIEKAVADVADLKKSKSPVEYILKAMSLLKEIYNG